MKEKILLALLETPHNRLDFWQLVKRTGYIPEVIQTLKSLKQRGIVKLGDTTITLTSRKRVPAYLLKKAPPLAEVMRQYVQYRKRFNFQNDHFDQLAILPEGIALKLSLMLARGDLRNRDIVCIGDDDLYSIACSLTGLPKSITVIDIDTTILASLKRIVKKLPVRIRTVKGNLITGIPRALRSQFDVFITEPPDTVRGMQLFIARGIAMLKKEGAAYFGMTHETVNPKQWHTIEKILLGSNFAITDILYASEPYETVHDELGWQGFEKLPPWIAQPAKKPWFASTLFRAELVGTKKTPRVTLEDPKHPDKELITSLLP